MHKKVYSIIAEFNPGSPSILQLHTVKYKVSLASTHRTWQQMQSEQYNYSDFRDEFMCPDSECIPAGWECDGVDDCSPVFGIHIDEYFCENSTNWEECGMFCCCH